MTIENQLFEDIYISYYKNGDAPASHATFRGAHDFRTIQLRCEFCWFKNSYPFAGEMRQLTQENLRLFLGFEYLSLSFGQISCTETITYSINNKMYMCICL